MVEFAAGDLAAVAVGVVGFGKGIEMRKGREWMAVAPEVAAEE
jgi:hypothetical protein